MRLLLALLAASVATLQAEPKRLELGFPQLAERIQIVFPENYRDDRQWPAVFYYHGTGGHPDTGLIRAHTGDRDFFVVGMTYVQQGSFRYSEEALEDEWRILHSTRHHLASKWNVDPKRVYVAGFSKGGWMSGFLLQRDPDLAGAIILGAGHVHQVRANPPRFPHQKPLFVGVGRQDGNYPFSLRALVFFRPLNVQTTFETWHGLGHSFPPDGSPALRQWLQLEGRPDEDHRPAARTWLDSRIDEIKSVPDPVDQWVALHDVAQSPFVRVLGEAAKTEVEDAIAALEKGGRVAVEAKALSEHRTLLRKEMGRQSEVPYEALLSAYLKLSESYPGSRQAEIALHDFERIKRLLQHFKEQERLASEKKDSEFNPFPDDAPPANPFPKPPSRNPVIPRNPLVR